MLEDGRVKVISFTVRPTVRFRNGLADDSEMDETAISDLVSWSIGEDGRKFLLK